MAAVLNSGGARVTVLVDCDNVSPEVLEHALKVVIACPPSRCRWKADGVGDHDSISDCRADQKEEDV